MDPLAILVALFVFATIVCFVLGIASGGQSQSSAAARARLDGFRQGGTDPELTIARVGIMSRVFGPALHGAAAAFGNLLPKSMLKGVERQLLIAGEPMTMQGFLTMVLVASVAATGLGFLIVVTSGIKLVPTGAGILAATSLIGFYMPFYLVKSRSKQRQHAIIKSLPDAFDLITTCVEAGLGLDAALARVAEKVEGPFADELSRTLRDIALGKSRRDALKELGQRTGVPDLIQFTNAVVQAESMGSSVGQVLRVQADQLRVARRQRAEQAAYKAPVKMLFPLVLFIFPSLFIVILGPAIITIMKGFPK